MAVPKEMKVRGVIANPVETEVVGVRAERIQVEADLKDAILNAGIANPVIQEVVDQGIVDREIPDRVLNLPGRAATTVVHALFRVHHRLHRRLRLQQRLVARVCRPSSGISDLAVTVVKEPGKRKTLDSVRSN
jgi:hypothetical protein